MKVIFEPIITEKATNDSELRNRYTFVVNRERKTKFTKRGVQRTKTNIKKKAIVDIQDGDSIDFYNNL